MSKNSDYFQIYCGLAAELYSRPDKDSAAIKSTIRFVIREATNTASNLPGYDNKLGSEFMSLKAEEQLKRGLFDNLVGEHIVPVSVIIKVLENGNDFSKENISSTIKKLSAKAVITKKEDDLLKKAGFSNKMPLNWNTGDIKARYDAVGIKLIDSKYKELKAIRKTNS